MRILHVITSLRTGGAEKLMVDLLPRLRDMGLEVELCVFDGLRTPFFDQLEEKGIKIHTLTNSSYSLLNVAKLLPLMRKFDVVHTHNTPCQFAAAILKCLYKGRLVTTEHSTSNRRRGHSWMLFFDKWMYKQNNKIICVSETAAQNIIDYTRCYNLDIDVIANGIDTSIFTNASPIDLGLESDRYKGVMVAGFRYEKDQETIIRAYSLLPEKYHLFLVGNGETINRHKQLADDLGISKRIHFLGVRTDVPQILKSADVVIMSSHREGLSLSNIEGMASGRPFVASDVEGLRDVTKDAGILCEHGNPQAFADAIRMLCEDKEYADSIAVACQERAKQYDINLMAERYAEVYLVEASLVEVTAAIKKTTGGNKKGIIFADLKTKHYLCPQK